VHDFPEGKKASQELNRREEEDGASHKKLFDKCRRRESKIKSTVLE